MDSAVRKVFRFEGYELDQGRGALTSSGLPVELRPKTFALLEYLVENCGRLIPKAELLDAIWPGIHVTEDSLVRCVHELRLALGGDRQRILKTVPRRGYLLDVPVTSASATTAGAVEVDGPARPIRVPTPDRRWPPRSRALFPILAGVVALFLLAAWLFATGRPPAPASPGRPSIAVLPFTNLSGRAEEDYFADGLSADLTSSLSLFGELFVIARNSAFAYKNSDLSAPMIGQALGVRYLVMGTVRRDAERLRISAELVEAATGTQLWAEIFDRDVAGVFSIQDEVIGNIVGALLGRINRSELDRVRRTPPEQMAAYDYYLRGNALLNSRQGEERGAMVAEARRLYEAAVAADPNYAAATQGLAHTYAVAWLEPTTYEPLRSEHRQSVTLDRGLELARRAVELDPFSAEAHATLAWILHWQYRREEALSAFERAFDLNPNLADGRYVQMLTHNGRAIDAVAFMDRILLQDPFPPPIYLSWYGNAQYLAGRYDDAFATLQSGTMLLPDHQAMLVWLAAAAAKSGRAIEAAEEAAEVLRRNPAFSVANWLRHIQFAIEADAAHLAEGLRMAGLE